MPSAKLFRGQKWVLYVICRYSSMLHPKMLRYAEICPQYWRLYMLYASFINVMCKFMYDMRYLIYCVFSFICNASWSSYDISICYAACLKPYIYYVVSKNPFLCLNSFITWAKIALSVSIFVASSLLCCICKIIHLCRRLYVALANSPFDLY